MSRSSSAPLRLLVLATTFPAQPGDGTPEFVLSLSAALARLGAEVTVVAPRVRRAATEDVFGSVRVSRFAYFPRRWERLAEGAIMANLRAQPFLIVQVIPFLIAFQVAALRAVRQSRPEVVHAHWIIPGGLVARVIWLLTGVPYVLTAHGADAYTLRSRLSLRLKRSVLAHAAVTLPVSADIGLVLGSVGNVRPPIPMGVDVTSVRRDTSLRSPEPGMVLFVGRLVEKKGVDVLLRAAARVDGAHIVIVGDGPLRAEYADLASELGLADRVEMVGKLARGDVMRQLSRAALVALPSRPGSDGDQDGVPVVLGEAVAAGVPVVASRLGGLAEWLTDGVTARLVAPGSVLELAAAISELLEDSSEGERISRNAREQVLPGLDVDHVATAYMLELRAALARL